MRTRLIAVLSCAALALTANAGRAQVRDVAVGAGIGLTSSARASGQAYHGAVNFTLTTPTALLPESGPWDERPHRHVGPTVQLRAEVFYQGGTATGSPFSCERVAQFYCLGRVDQNRLGGGAVFVRVAPPLCGRMRSSADPFGAGLYHRRTKSREVQAPIALCIINDELVSCPNNPPWATYEYRSSRTSVGANTGLGMQLQLGGLRMFAELRVHQLFESGESSAGAVPVTFGVVF